MDFDGLGAKFWWKFVGVMLLCAVGVGIILILFTRAAVAWGAFGALLVLGGVGILIGWIHDRRDKRSDIEVDYKPPPKLRG